VSFKLTQINVINGSTHFLRFIGEIYRKCLNIQVLDGIGRPRDELADGLFSLPHKKYMIFFLRNDECASIVRILRASRDIEAQFETE
jgi:plasmid stabilization system protein ParE